MYHEIKDRVIPFSVATFANEENATYQGLVFVYLSSCSATLQPLWVISCRRQENGKKGQAVEKNEGNSHQQSHITPHRPYRGRVIFPGVLSISVNASHAGRQLSRRH